MNYGAAATATARKLDTSESESATWTKPTAPPVTQNYPNRTAMPLQASRARPAWATPSSRPSPSIRARRSSKRPLRQTLFGSAVEADTLEAPVDQAAAKQPVKKSPSLFERFTMGREKETPVAAAPAKTDTKLTVEDGGKKDEDELDIPRFPASPGELKNIDTKKPAGNAGLFLCGSGP